MLCWGRPGGVPVSGASEPEGRNPAGGTGKAERRRTQGAARRLRRQARRCPVMPGGKRSNEKGINVIQAVRLTVRIHVPNINFALNSVRPKSRSTPKRHARTIAPGSCRCWWTSRLRRRSRGSPCLQPRSATREQWRLQESASPRDRVRQTATSLRFREIGIDIQAADGC